MQPKTPLCSPELHGDKYLRVGLDEVLSSFGQPNKSGPESLYLAAETDRALAGKGPRLMSSIPHSPVLRVTERQALSSWQALQVVQAALLEIESGRALSDAGRRRTFEALATVAQAVAA